MIFILNRFRRRNVKAKFDQSFHRVGIKSGNNFDCGWSGRPSQNKREETKVRMLSLLKIIFEVDGSTATYSIAHRRAAVWLRTVPSKIRSSFDIGETRPQSSFASQSGAVLHLLERTGEFQFFGCSFADTQQNVGGVRPMPSKIFDRGALPGACEESSSSQWKGNWTTSIRCNAPTAASGNSTGRRPVTGKARNWNQRSVSASRLFLLSSEIQATIASGGTHAVA